VDIIEFDINNVPVFEVTSESLNEDVWNTDITNTANGSNVSPQLSWEAVNDASCYVVYMIDPIAGNWMHWISGSLSVNVLDEGYADNSEYVGPYPPGGTHTYVVYVFALETPMDEYPGQFDNSNKNWEDYLSEIDAANGTGGNIIAYGTLSGTYTYGD